MKKFSRYAVMLTVMVPVAGASAFASVDVSCKAASAPRTGRATIKVVGQ